MVRRISACGHIRDDKFLHAVGIAVGKYQGRLAAHAVADDTRALDVVFIEVVQHVLCHHFVAVLRVVGAPSVVALIDEVHSVGFSKAFSEGLPVVRSAEQAMEDYEVRGVFFAQFPAEEFEAIRHHVRGMSKQAR